MLNKISDLGEFKRIDIIKRGASGRILQLKIIGTKSTIKLDNELQIRQNLGGLRSSLFILEKKEIKLFSLAKEAVMVLVCVKSVQ